MMCFSCTGWPENISIYLVKSSSSAVIAPTPLPGRKWDKFSSITGQSDCPLSYPRRTARLGFFSMSISGDVIAIPLSISPAFYAGFVCPFSGIVCRLVSPFILTVSLFSKFLCKFLHDQLDKVGKVLLSVGQVGQLCHAIFCMAILTFMTISPISPLSPVHFFSFHL